MVVARHDTEGSDESFGGSLRWDSPCIPSAELGERTLSDLAKSWNLAIAPFGVIFDGERVGTPELSPVFAWSSETKTSELHLVALRFRSWNSVVVFLRDWSALCRV